MTMIVCTFTGNGCKHKGKPQPVERFRSGRHILRSCIDCRRHRKKLRQNWGKARQGSHSDFVDPWVQVCQQCPLPDCVRNEGDYAVCLPTKEYPTCLVWIAGRRGLTPDEALELKVSEVLGG